MRQEMINYIKQCCDILSDSVKILNLKVDFFKLPTQWEKVPEEYIEEGYKWFKDLEYVIAEYKRTYNLCKPEIWESYYVDYAATKDFREMVMMTSIVNKIRPVLVGKTKPIILRKKEINRIVNRKKVKGIENVK